MTAKFKSNWRTNSDFTSDKAESPATRQLVLGFEAFRLIKWVTALSKEFTVVLNKLFCSNPTKAFYKVHKYIINNNIIFQKWTIEMMHLNCRSVVASIFILVSIGNSILWYVYDLTYLSLYFFDIPEITILKQNLLGPRGTFCVSKVNINKYWIYFNG